MSTRSESDTRLFAKESSHIPTSNGYGSKPHQLDSLLDELQSLGAESTLNGAQMDKKICQANVITVNDGPDDVTDYVRHINCL